MRRSFTAFAVVLMLVALVGTSVAAARPATSFVARANVAEQGGTMLVKAKVKHATKRTPYSATAIIHFASGDVSVDLRRRGRSYVALVRVPVAVDEALGAVPVEVTIAYGETSQVLAAEGTVVVAELDEVELDEVETEL